MGQIIRGAAAPKDTVIFGEANDEAVKFFEEAVAEHGCYCAADEVEIDRSRSTMAVHTVGLSDKGWPELVLVGIEPQVAAAVLTKLVGRGAAFKAGDVIDDVAMVPMRCEPLSEDAISKFLGQAVAFRLAHGGFEIEALQLVFTDEEKRWPEDEGYNKAATAAQVLLKDYRKH